MTDTANPSTKESLVSGGHQTDGDPVAEGDDPFQWADTNGNPLAKRMEKGRHSLGKLLRSWIALNGWTYDDVTSIILTFSGGLPLLHGSQISNLIRGKLEPKPKLFVGLECLNKACDTNEQDRAKLDPKIAKKLVDVRVVANASSPLEKTKPWKAGDFLNHFCGLRYPPISWLDIEALDNINSYEYAQVFAKIIKRLADTRKRDYYPTYSTITSFFPRSIESHAMTTAAGATTIPEDQLEQYLILYARGLGSWLGAEVTPWKLVKLITRFLKEPDLSIDLCEYFITPETIYKDGRTETETQVQISCSSLDEQRLGEEYLDFLREIDNDN